MVDTLVPLNGHVRIRAWEKQDDGTEIEVYNKTIKNLEKLKTKPKELVICFPIYNKNNFKFKGLDFRYNSTIDTPKRTAIIGARKLIIVHKN